MTLRDGVQLRRVGHVMEYQMENELTLYDPVAEAVHILNPTAAMVWRLCDGTRDLNEVASELSARYTVSPEAVRDDVRDVLAQFQQARLLQMSAGMDGQG